MCTQVRDEWEMFTAALFLTGENWKQPKYPVKRMNA